MFCIYCGMNMPKEANFCPKCGKLNLSSQTEYTAIKYVQPHIEQSNAIDHDVLVSYLERLYVMETSVLILGEEKNKIQQKISMLGYEGNISEPQKPITGIYNEEIASCLGVTIFALFILVISMLLQRHIKIGILDAVVIVSFFIIIIFAVGLGYFVTKSDTEDQLNKNKYKSDLEKYQKDLENVGIRIQQEQKEKEELHTIAKKITSEQKRAEDILDHYYRVNYIPKPHRNIRAVYYLYDYISSSRVSLDTALLHLKLEMIEEKIDMLIRQNAIIILQNAIMISQNGELIRQYDQILQRAINIEKDTTKIAQYKEISAANTESITFLEEVMIKYVDQEK